MSESFSKRALIANQSAARRAIRSVVPHRRLDVPDTGLGPVLLPSDEEPDPRDPYSTLIPAGAYDVGFLKAERQRNFGKSSNLIFMRILDGPEADRVILFPVPCIPEGSPPRPNFKYSQLWVACTDRRPPRDLWRRRPKNFMSGCCFRVSVCTVTNDSRGELRPDQLHYSRIEKVLKRIAGTPPCLLGRNCG